MKLRIRSGHYMCHPETCSCDQYAVEYLTKDTFGNDLWMRLFSSDDYDYIMWKLERDYNGSILVK